MTDQPSVLSHAMRYGTYMGCYWMMKFFFLPLSVTIPIFQLFFILATLFTPFLAMMYAIRYKRKYCNGIISYGQAFRFHFMLFVFASLFITLIHFIYFEFIDHHFLYNHLMQELNTVNHSPYQLDPILLQNTKEVLARLDAMPAINKTLQLLFNNIYWGFLLSFILALATKIINTKNNQR